LKGFLFTFDAVLAAAILVLAPLALALLATPSADLGYASAMQQYGYGWLKQGAPALSNAGYSVSKTPAAKGYAIRAVRFQHPGYCHATDSTAQCLYGFDANVSSYTEAFVS